jgi:hypothetical protein
MSKKVSIKEINSALKGIKDIPNTIKIHFGTEDTGFDAEFNMNLTLTEKILLVKMVINGCFINGEYQPEYKHIAKVYAILNVMSNISLPTSDKGINLSVLHDWDTKFDFLSVLRTNIGKYVYDIERVIDEKIEYLKNKSKSDVFFETLNKLANQYGEKLKDLNVQDVMDTFNHIKDMDEGKFTTVIVENAKANKKDNITKLDEVKAK